MLLLDLPPELFEHVIVHLVTDLGIKEAWAYRKVCRTFRRAIEFECLANRPTISFLGQHSARRILRKNNGLYLSYRVKAENGAYSFLPRLIKRACDDACSGLDFNEQVFLKSTRALCDAVVKKFPDRINALLERKSPNQSWVKFLVYRFLKGEFKKRVAAAAAFGNLQVLRTALCRTPWKIWDMSHIFGYPIALDAAEGHLDVVRAIVKQFEKTHHSMKADQWAD